MDLYFLSLERMRRNVTNQLGVMLSESEASAFPMGYEKADASAVPQNDVRTQSLMGKDEGEGDQQITLISTSAARGEADRTWGRSQSRCRKAI